MAFILIATALSCGLLAVVIDAVVRATGGRIDMGIGMLLMFWCFRLGLIVLALRVGWELAKRARLQLPSLRAFRAIQPRHHFEDFGELVACVICCRRIVRWQDDSAALPEANSAISRRFAPRAEDHFVAVFEKAAGFGIRQLHWIFAAPRQLEQAAAAVFGGAGHGAAADQV